MLRNRTAPLLLQSSLLLRFAEPILKLVAGGGLEHTQAELMRLTFTLNPRDNLAPQTGIEPA